MRNKPRNHSTKEAEYKYKITEVYDHKGLPASYVGFPDDVANAVKRISELEEKLSKRGFRVPHPLRITRLVQSKNTVSIGKKNKQTDRVVPNTMLAVEVEEISNA